MAVLKPNHTKDSDSQRKVKSLKRIAGILAGLLFVMFGAALFVIITTRKATLFLGAPIALMPALIILKNRIKKLESRKG
jgi:uncharacterized membrane protein YccC